MMWLTPKTNWINEDYVNATDYNRIKGNIEHLSTLFEKLVGKVNLQDMGDDKTFKDFPYIEDWNAVEANLVILDDSLANVLDQSAIVEFGYRYRAGAKYLMSDQLKQIEEFTKILFEYANFSIEGLRRLPIRLGGGNY